MRTLQRTVLAVGAMLLAAPVALAEPVIEYRVEWLTSAQRKRLDAQVENYAMVEAFLNACGPAPRFEARVRSAAAGCIAKESLNTIAARFRSLTAASAARGAWRCGEADVVRFAGEMRRVLDLTISDIVSACKGNGPPPNTLGD